MFRNSVVKHNNLQSVDEPIPLQNRREHLPCRNLQDAHGKMTIVGKCLTHTHRKESFVTLAIIMLCQVFLMLNEMVVIIELPCYFNDCCAFNFRSKTSRLRVLQATKIHSKGKIDHI